jgi:small subunit ribosomal protein S21
MNNQDSNKKPYQKKPYEKKQYDRKPYKKEAPKKPRENQLSPTEVTVRDNNIEQALRVLKNKMAKENVLGDLRARRYFEKPSEKKRRKMREALRKAVPSKKKPWVKRSKVVASVPINKWDE